MVRGGLCMVSGVWLVIYVCGGLYECGGLYVWCGGLCVCGGFCSVEEFHCILIFAAASTNICCVLCNNAIMQQNYNQSNSILSRIYSSVS